MRRLRKRPRLDTLLNQQRGAPVNWGRRIYLVLLAALALAILDYLVGDAVILRADGILLTDRQIVASTYPARVTAVRVREGDTVAQGAVLLELESAEMLKDIADLAVRNADIAVRGEQLRGRIAIVSALRPLAERNARETREAVARFETMTERGLVSTLNMNQSLSSAYDTAVKLAELNAQAETLERELKLVEENQRRAEQALSQLEAFYDHGKVRAAVAGTVGPRVPVVGQVAKFGDELLQILGHNAYVLAHLPDMYLFGLAPGDRVTISGGAGSRTVTGTVEAMLTVADALPPEFQNMFRPRDRSRLVRISVPADNGLAILQKVRVGGCVVGWCWSGRSWINPASAGTALPRWSSPPA